MNALDKPQALEALFEGDSAALALYNAFEKALLARRPETDIVVQKTQVTFRNRHVFAAAWPTPGRVAAKRRPAVSVGITLGLARPLDSPRAFQIVEPYPGRFTNHLLIAEPGDIDAQLTDWAQEAYDYAMVK